MLATKRTRATRNTRSRVTAEAVALFREGEPLKAKYIACLDSPCVPEKREHCADCDRAIDLSNALSRELKLRPHEWTPFHVIHYDPPVSPDAGWQQAVDLLKELRDAD